MREIKFRAWMKHDKVMLSHEQLMSIPVTYHDVFEGNNKYPCMQYTGLKDKNGVEIYEGDILQSYARTYLGKVKFEDGCFIFENNRFKTNTLIHFMGDTYFEVIGNIYENSDFLK